MSQPALRSEVFPKLDDPMASYSSQTPVPLSHIAESSTQPRLYLSQC